MVEAGTGEGRVKIVQGFIWQKFNESLTGCDNRWKHKAEFLAVCHWGFYFDLSIVLVAFGSSYSQVNSLKTMRPWTGWTLLPHSFHSPSETTATQLCDTFLAQDTIIRESFQGSWLFSHLEPKTNKEKEQNQTKPVLVLQETISSYSTPMGRNYERGRNGKQDPTWFSILSSQGPLV